MERKSTASSLGTLTKDTTINEERAVEAQCMMHMGPSSSSTYLFLV